MPPRKPGKASKPEKPAAPASPPVCTILTLCENVVTGTDGSSTVFRIVDTVWLAPGTNVPIEEGVELPGLKIYALLKAGGSKRKFKFTMTVRGPDGEADVIGAVIGEFPGGPLSGANVVSPMRFHWRGHGVYWLELGDGEGAVLARAPFLVQPGESQKE